MPEKIADLTCRGPMAAAWLYHSVPAYASRRSDCNAFGDMLSAGFCCTESEVEFWERLHELD